MLESDWGIKFQFITQVAEMIEFIIAQNELSTMPLFIHQDQGDCASRIFTKG
jgi:hypothetical protein